MNLAVCILIEREGKVLAVSRKNNPEAFGLPGGKVEPGESLEEAASRELQEETGLILNNPRSVFKRMPDPKDPYLCTTFVGDISGEISTQEKGIVAWVTWDNLISGPFGDYNDNLYKYLYANSN